LAAVVRRRSRLGRGEAIAGWLFAAPWIVGFFLWTLGPMVAAAYFSLTKWDLLSAPIWVGLDNFRDLLTRDASFINSVQVTTQFAIISVPLHIVLGLGLAMLLNTRVRGLRVYRSIFYLPAVLSGVAVALLWAWVYSASFGLANYLLSLVGVQGPKWLQDPRWALWSIIFMSLWGVGAGMVIYLAGLQGIPSELYDAAAVDGANWLHSFRHVTLPMISPVLFFQLVIGIIQGLQTFTQVAILTDGGPHDSTLFLLLYLYHSAFRFLKMGYGSAIAWMLFFYILALTLVVFRFGRLWVYYEGDSRSGGK
jgi:multiple sugar transport system permease protein